MSKMAWLDKRLMNRTRKGLMYMFTILFLNQKGGYSSAPAPQQAPVLLAVDLYDEDIPF